MRMADSAILDFTHNALSTSGCIEKPNDNGEPKRSHNYIMTLYKLDILEQAFNKHKYMLYVTLADTLGSLPHGASDALRIPPRGE